MNTGIKKMNNDIHIHVQVHVQVHVQHVGTCTCS